MGMFEQLFAPLERLINEHGSAAILRERLELVKAKMADYERREGQLESENAQLKAKLEEAERQLGRLTSGHHDGFCCDACGSPSVKRTGSRPDPTFGPLGIKQALFTCADCGAVSAFTLEPKQ